MTISQEDFDAWLENPVTEAMMAFLDSDMERTRANWNAASWDNEALWGDDQARFLRTACKARAEALEDIRKITFEEFNEWQQERGSPDRV